jgi:hypothetical protein
VLRTNLSTRPFYNERAVHVLLAALAALVLVLTAVNVYEIIKLSRQNTELSTRVDRERDEAQRLTSEAGRIRRAINQDELQLVVDAAREANSIIDQRTFSWTQFFNVLEENMPPDVMLSAVQPTVSEEGTQVSMVVLGRRSEDIQEFIEKLEASGAFEGLLPSQTEALDTGLTRAVVEGVYVPVTDEPDAAPVEPKKMANGGNR